MLEFDAYVMLSDVKGRTCRTKRAITIMMARTKVEDVCQLVAYTALFPRSPISSARGYAIWSLPRRVRGSQPPPRHVSLASLQEDIYLAEWSPFCATLSPSFHIDNPVESFRRRHIHYSLVYHPWRLFPSFLGRSTMRRTAPPTAFVVSPTL